MEVPGWPENIEEISDDIRRFMSLEHRIAYLKAEINAICQSLDDPWAFAVVTLDSNDNSIIDDEGDKVRLYLKNVEMLWRLGTTPEEQLTTSAASEAAVAA